MSSGTPNNVAISPATALGSRVRAIRDDNIRARPAHSLCWLATCSLRSDGAERLRRSRMYRYSNQRQNQLRDDLHHFAFGLHNQTGVFRKLLDALPIKAALGVVKRRLCARRLTSQVVSFSF
jgi:hypothetical protein